MSQVWKILDLDFESFSIDVIANKTFQALGFYISATGYLEKGPPCFTDVTNLELTAKPVVVDNLGLVVTDSKEEVVKNKNKRAAKRKKRLKKLRALIGSLLFSRLESLSLLSLHPMPALVPALVPAPVPAPLSAPVPALILAPILALMPTPVSCLRSLTVLFSCRMLRLYLQLLPPFILLLVFVLDPLLCRSLVLCPFQLFLIAEFQLFYHHFLYFIHFFLLNLHLSEHSNNPY